MSAGGWSPWTWLLDCLHLDQRGKLPGSYLIQPLPQVQAAAACWGDGDGVPDEDKQQLAEGTCVRFSGEGYCVHHGCVFVCVPRAEPGPVHAHQTSLIKSTT